MIAFLLAPPSIWIVIAAIVLLFLLVILQVYFEDSGGVEYLIYLSMAFIAIYLLWHAGAWVIARFMNTVQSYR